MSGKYECPICGGSLCYKVTLTVDVPVGRSGTPKTKGVRIKRAQIDEAVSNQRDSIECSTCKRKYSYRIGAGMFSLQGERVFPKTMATATPHKPKFKV